MKKWIEALFPIADIFLVPFVCIAAWLLKSIRRAGIQGFPLCKKTLFTVGVFPIRDHYYEPQFDMRKMRRPCSEERSLPGINWNIQEQLEMLARFSFSEELRAFPTETSDDLSFCFDNGGFESGDAEYWYQLIRLKKPRRIFEIGSGNSTLMAINAVQKNQAENPDYECKHVCVEPYEMPWLERTGVSVLRQKVEDVGTSLFSELEKDDVLFIDSSHIIRPDGDVLFEYLELLPCLSMGVIVHVHDIFSPRNYPHEWLVSAVRFWNEQYLLEAFLSHNDSWQIIGSLNYLHHRYFEKLKTVCPFLTPDREPGSFYIQRAV